MAAKKDPVKQDLLARLSKLGDPGSLYKMEAPGRALTIGLISGVHTYLMSSEPGEGKTTLAWRFLSHLDIPDEEKVFISGYRGAGEEQVVGYPSPAAIREGRMDFLPGKSARSGKVVFIDEFDKMNRAAQESVLQIAASRRFSRAGFDQLCPLELLIGMGNAMPEERPVRDRFGLQLAIEQLSTDEKMQLLDLPNKLDDPAGAVTWTDIQEARELMESVKGMNQTLRNLTGELITRFELTNRRVRTQLMPALKAAAVLNGRSQITLYEIQEIAPLICFHKDKISAHLQKELREEIQKRIDEIEQELAKKKRAEDVGEACKELGDALAAAQAADISSFAELATAMHLAEKLQIVATKLEANNPIRRSAEDLVNHTQTSVIKLFAARGVIQKRTTTG